MEMAPDNLGVHWESIQDARMGTCHEIQKPATLESAGFSCDAVILTG
jgi:hypothetical protein